MKYHEQIKHPLWQKKRLEVLELNNFTCSECSNETEELNVHHPFYKRGAMIWDYEAIELQCLCKTCHAKNHIIDEEIKKSLSGLSSSQKMVVFGYINSMIGPFYQDDEDYMPGYVDGVRNNDRYISSLLRQEFTICK